jgi:hypothetical protein
MRTERGGLVGADERLTAGCRASPLLVAPVDRQHQLRHRGPA